MFRSIAAAVACMGIAAGPVRAGEGLTMSSNGKTQCVIAISEKPSAAEKHAAEELAGFLGKVTGAKFPVTTIAQAQAGKAGIIAVGPEAARQIDPALKLDGLGNDGYVMRTSGTDLVLTGGSGAPRGTLYAVYAFLEDTVGCRWWSAKAATIPRKPDLSVAPLDVRHVPPLEYREVLYLDAYDGDWAVRNKVNGNFARLDDARGGKITYAKNAFVHSFYALVPPAEYFAAHPEWYSEINGKRISDHAQLCLSNPQLQAFIIDRVRTWLKDNPDIDIISVSQNDWYRRCECKDCLAIEAVEKSPSGPVLRLVNAVAAAVEKDYPRVAIDTLAYQYTLKPPAVTRPRPNVIIRLCTSECSFAQPLTGEQNKAFREVIEGWSRICNRLYIWDYVVNFRHYVQPHPNLRVLSPNVRFFIAHHAKGILEQGDHTSLGGELAELRAWVLAKLLWNPSLDGDKLIDEFLDGYYGPAAPLLRKYIRLMQDQVDRTGYYLKFSAPPDAPFLTAEALVESEKLFGQAKAAVAKNPELLRRVEVTQLPIRYVFIVQWKELQLACAAAKMPWPLSGTQLDAIADFERVFKENDITRLSEWVVGTDVLRKKFLQP